MEIWTPPTSLLNRPLSSIWIDKPFPISPMPKVDINKVAESLKRHSVEPAQMRQVIEDLNRIADATSGEEEKAPAIKKQFAIVISDPENRLPSFDFAGWVIQIPEEESVGLAMERVHRAAYEFNTTKKGRLLPVKTIGEAMESVPAKHFKEQQVWVKTKSPVLMLKTDNVLPKEAPVEA